MPKAEYIEQIPLSNARFIIDGGFAKYILDVKINPRLPGLPGTLIPKYPLIQIDMHP